MTADKTGYDNLPDVATLAREPDPSKRLIALVEPATNMLIRATAISEVNETRSRAAALERYARSIKLSSEAIGAAQTIARRAETRIGQLDIKRKPPGKRSLSENNDLTRWDRHDFRTMADESPTVERVLGELAPNGKATRSAVLHELKRQGMEDWARQVEERTEDGVAEMLELKRVLRRTLLVLRRMNDNGRTFDAAPLAWSVTSLCREIVEALP